MSSHEKVRLTLDERLALAEQSRASSPEAAAALVRRLAGLPAGYVCCRSPDAQTFYDLTGEFWDDPRVDVDSYRRFCNIFLAAMEESSCSGPLSRQPQSTELRRPVWGTRVNNALVLLGEMLLDRTMDRCRGEEVRRCLHMTLGQYLYVLSGPDFQRSASQVDWFASWRDSLLQETDGGQPLSQALAGILRRYMTGWRVLDRLDHTLLCLGGLALHEEQAGTRYDVSLDPDRSAGEGDIPLLMKVYRTEDAAAANHLRRELRRCGIGRYPSDLPEPDPDCQDARAYFLQLAQDYAPDLPDPGGEMEAGTLRGQLFLPDWNYGPAVLREVAEQSPFPAFGPLLAECLDDERVSGAFREVNKAVIDLYMLLVEPYLHMQE